jgi:hypothetical protein
LLVVGCWPEALDVSGGGQQLTTNNQQPMLSARRITRRLCLVSGISAPLGWSLAVPRLLIRKEPDSLRISAPQIRFLTGKSLESLKNGVKVGFASVISLSLDSASNVVTHKADRFVLSYDIWEEKFSATRLTPPVKSMERLSVPAAEAWCLDLRLPIPAALTPSRSFWIKLELRAEDPKESAAIVGEPGINLTRLVEIFSRPPRNPQQRWMESAGPLRLQDM